MEVRSLRVRRGRGGAIALAVAVVGLIASGLVWSGEADGAENDARHVRFGWLADSDTTLLVEWTTSSSRVPDVRYREVGSGAWWTESASLRQTDPTGRRWWTELTGLEPATAYEVQIEGTDAGSYSVSSIVETAPALGATAAFEAVYVADTGLSGRTDGLAEGTDAVAEAIADLDPLLVLGGGDYAYFNTDKRYGTLDASIDAWLEQSQPFLSTSVFMPTYGNHEILLGEGYDDWADRFATPDGWNDRRAYSFDVGDVHFISILAQHEIGRLPDAEAEWIEADIAAAQAAGRRWIIPYLHGAPFSEGESHPSNLPLRTQLGRLFGRYDIHLVLYSHDQSFERTYPLEDVPSANRPTSTALDCYEMSDGIVWLKTSPGGKLSNKGGGFSQWSSDVVPEWTAVRDNTAHHFTHLRFQHDGSLTVDTYGVRVDPDETELQDRFTFSTTGCPYEPGGPALTTTSPTTTTTTTTPPTTTAPPTTTTVPTTTTTTTAPPTTTTPPASTSTTAPPTAVPPTTVPPTPVPPTGFSGSSGPLDCSTLQYARANMAESLEDVVGVGLGPTGGLIWVTADGGLHSGDPDVLASLAPAERDGHIWADDELRPVLLEVPDPEGFAPAPVAERIVGFARTATAKGLWLFSSLGRVFPYGDAAWAGDLAALGVTPARPVSGGAATADDGGYWMFARDGGLFAFGSASFHGSVPGVLAATGDHLQDDIVAMTAGEGGYLLVAQDGGAFAFGAVVYRGSLPELGVSPVAPIVGGVSSGSGYLHVGADGGLFAFGGVRFHGSVPFEQSCNAAGHSVQEGAPIVHVLALPEGDGYVLTDASGRTHGFGAGAELVVAGG